MAQAVYAALRPQLANPGSRFPGAPNAVWLGVARATGDGVENQRSPEGEAQVSPSERRAWMPVANVRRRGTGDPEPRWTQFSI
jgi:hypothetical protein